LCLLNDLAAACIYVILLVIPERKLIMDPRDKEAMDGKWYDHISEKNMTICVILFDDDENEFEAFFPFNYKICDLCQGKGRHVNPGIDSEGITGSEMEELGSEFEETYFSGGFDVDCYRCNSKRVEPEIDEEEVNRSEELKKNYELLLAKWKDDSAYEAERDAERRMGC
jgi:hypothetical protein